MVRQVIRAVELPISISVGLALRGAALAARVTDWAVTGLVRELSRDEREEAEAPVVDEHPLASAPEVDEHPPASAPEVDEHPLATAPRVDESPEVEESPLTEVAPTIEPEPETAPVADEERDLVPVPDEDAELAPVADEDTEAPAIDGAHGGVVEHEPGIGTSVRARNPHSALNNPITEADLTEWPDPYDHREDPRDPGEEMVFGGDAGHTQTGATSTSEPHPSQDPEAQPWEGPKRDKVDD